MARTRKSATTEDKDEVDQAVAGVRRAIARLVKLLEGSDLGQYQRMGDHLVALGGPAVGPLVSALSQTRDTTHRMQILALLESLPFEDELKAIPVLTQIVTHEPAPAIRAFAGRLLERLVLHDALCTSTYAAELNSSRN